MFQLELSGEIKWKDCYCLSLDLSLIRPKCNSLGKRSQTKALSHGDFTHSLLPQKLIQYAYYIPCFDIVTGSQPYSYPHLVLRHAMQPNTVDHMVPSVVCRWCNSVSGKCRPNTSVLFVLCNYLILVTRCIGRVMDWQGLELSLLLTWRSLVECLVQWLSLEKKNRMLLSINVLVCEY